MEWVIIGGVMLLVAMRRRSSGGQPSEEHSDKQLAPKPKSEIQKQDDFSKGIDDLTKIIGPVGVGIATGLGVGVGAAAGYGFSQLFNEALLKADPKGDKGLEGLKAVSRFVSTVGFTTAGALITIAPPVALLVFAGTVVVIGLLFFIYSLIFPHPVRELAGEPRRKAIVNYEQTREEMFKTTKDALILGYGTSISEGKIDLYAASFVDGFTRTQDAIAFESWRVDHDNENAILNGDAQRERGLWVGLEWSRIMTLLEFGNSNFDDSRSWSGGWVQDHRSAKGDIKYASASYRNEPAFKTLTEYYAKKWPNEFPISTYLIQRREGRWAEHGWRAIGEWVVVEEWFGQGEMAEMYDAGANMARGYAYVAAMKTFTSHGKDEIAALQEAKRVRLAPSHATTDSVTFPTLTGEPLTFNWRDKPIPKLEEG